MRDYANRTAEASSAGTGTAATPGASDIVRLVGSVPARADATGEALITRVGADEHVLLDAGCPAPYVWRRVVVQRPEMIPADETIEFAAIDLRCVVGGR